MQEDEPGAGAQGVRSWSRLTEEDIYLFNEGRHFRLYDKLGAHLGEANGAPGVVFAVWAPNAAKVTVMGDFNGWDKRSHPLSPRGRSGIWETFVAGAQKGARYKFHIVSREGGYQVDKADPFAFGGEIPPRTASVVRSLSYAWGDHAWMNERGARQALDAPMTIYEVHLGSWMRVPEEGDRFMTYRELAPRLANYCRDMGFTHVELMPVMEHPFYGSWGYQTTGYFATTARYGTPQDLMALIDHLHQAGIGVILDWVPGHFPSDEHGLSFFDGTHLFEHADPRKGFHPEWQSLIFNYGRHEVRSFLISSALFWLDRFHADGIRVDGVASMLYLDYAREHGEWLPNPSGGNENLEAIALLRQLNEAAYEAFPDVQMMAEESTAWPMVSRPTKIGGLGFGLKWDMGWMHDTLRYLSHEPVHRRYHHNDLTFRALYAYTENYVLPLSHDEVVHGKGSLLDKMPGDDWQKRANLRLLLADLAAQPGKKLLFMGGELGQWSEWDHDHSLAWHLLEDEGHRGLQRWVRDLNRFYRAEPAMHEGDVEPFGFEWIDASDADQSVVSWVRWSRDRTRCVLAVGNFTPVPREGYRVGVPFGGWWQEVLNGDAEAYGGSGVGNLGGVDAERVPQHGRDASVELALPPLAMIFLRGLAEP